MSAFVCAEWITHVLDHETLEGWDVFKAPAGASIKSGIAFKQLSGRDGGTNQKRTLSVYRYFIAAFEEADNLDGLREPAAALDALLEGGSGLTSSGIVHHCQREGGEKDMAEPLKGGGIRQHLGGIYRITVKGA